MTEHPEHTDLYKKRVRAELITRAAWVVVAVALCVTIGLGIISLRALESNQEALKTKVDETHEAATTSAAILHVLDDCLHPGGKCYARSKASTADVLRSAEVIIIAAEACTHETNIPSSYSALAVCVDSLVRQHQ